MNPSGLFLRCFIFWRLLYVGPPPSLNVPFPRLPSQTSPPASSQSTLSSFQYHTSRIRDCSPESRFLKSPLTKYLVGVCFGSFFPVRSPRRVLIPSHPSGDWTLR